MVIAVRVTGIVNVTKWAGWGVTQMVGNCGENAENPGILPWHGGCIWVGVRARGLGTRRE